MPTSFAITGRLTKTRAQVKDDIQAAGMVFEPRINNKHQPDYLVVGESVTAQDSRKTEQAKERGIEMINEAQLYVLLDLADLKINKPPRSKSRTPSKSEDDETFDMSTSRTKQPKRAKQSKAKMTRQLLSASSMEESDEVLAPPPPRKSRLLQK